MKMLFCLSENWSLLVRILAQDVIGVALKSHHLSFALFSQPKENNFKQKHSLVIKFLAGIAILCM